ncbi:MAG: hypothetical protein LBM92_02495, partial [Opitutaceae bacterium]|nr:hypothetical protein [Opitutaceae bacterium]
MTRGRKIAVFALILLASLVAGGLECSRMAASQRAKLAGDSLHYALSFPAGETSGLAGGRADAGTELFQQISTRMAAVRESHSTVEFLCLLRLDTATGRVVCLAAEGGEGEIPRPGDSLDGTADARAARELAAGARTFVNPPHRGRAGKHWVSGYAVAGGGRAVKNAPAVDVLRYDADAGHWARAIGGAVAERVAVVWLLLGLPFAAFLLGKRHNRQEMLIQKLSEAVEQSDTAIMIAKHNGDIEYANP